MQLEVLAGELVEMKPTAVVKTGAVGRSKCSSLLFSEETGARVRNLVVQRNVCASEPRHQGNMTEELWHKMCTENKCGKSKTLNIKTNEKTHEADDGQRKKLVHTAYIMATQVKMSICSTHLLS